jgi:hypothetical protein
MPGDCNREVLLNVKGCNIKRHIPNFRFEIAQKGTAQLWAAPLRLNLLWAYDREAMIEEIGFRTLGITWSIQRVSARSAI